MKDKEKEKGEVSRRDFLVGAGAVVVGGAIGAGITYPLVAGKDGEVTTVTKTVSVPTTVTKTVGDGTAVTVTDTVTTTVGGDGATVTSTVTKTVADGDGVPPALELEETHLAYLWQLGAIDVKNGKIIRRRPLHYDSKFPGLEPFSYTVRGKTWNAPLKSPTGPYSTSYKKRVYSPNRVLYPLKRVDWEPGGDPAKTNTQNRGISKYKRISWDEATDIIASEFNRIIDTYGTEAITVIQSPHGERGIIHKDHGINKNFLDYWLTAKYGSTFSWGIGSPASWEGSAWGAKHVWGWEVWGQEPTTGLLKDVAENTEMLLHWGSDNVSKWWNKAHGHIGSSICFWLTELGIKSVYICPDVNSSAAVHADKWIPILPNTDSALQLAIAYTWITEDTYDKGYIATHSAGFDKFEEYVMGEEDGVPKTPEWASPLCGVPEWTIKALAREYATKVTSIAHSMDGGGLKRAPYCHENARFEVYLLAMQGWGRAGVHQIKGTLPIPSAKSSPRISKGRWPAQDGAANVPLLEEFGVKYSDNDTDRQFFPNPLLPEAILNPPVSFYGGGVRVVTETQFVKRTYPMPGKSEIHMLWSDGTGYFLAANMCTNRRIEAMKSPKIEFFLVQHLWMDSGTTMADIILPISTKYEKVDLHYLKDTITSLFIEKKCIETIGEAKSDYETVCEIAKKVGFYDEWTQGMSIDEWVRECYDGSGWTDLVSWEELNEKEYFPQQVDPDWQKVVPPALSFYNDPAGFPLSTPTGLIEFYSQRLADNFPDDKERGPVAHYVTGGPAAEGWSHDESLSGERAKTYPLLEISSNRHWGEHQQSTDDPWIREISKIKCWDGYLYEPIRINPVDAAARGIESGDIVKMYNERGAVLAAAMVSERVIPGAVDMNKGGGFDYIIPGELNRGGSNNSICPEMGLSKNALGLAVSGYLVEVEKVTGNQMDEWRKNYPEAFARDYNPAYGPLFSGWVEGGI